MGRSVSVAAKQTPAEEIALRLERDRQLCRCHGEPSSWHRDARRAAGGYWRCSVKRREADARYDATAKRRAARARYRKSEKGRATQTRYRLSDKGRATERRRILRASVRRREARIEEMTHEIHRWGTNLGFAISPGSAGGRRPDSQIWAKLEDSVR
jgi:hypothetical protein